MMRAQYIRFVHSVQTPGRAGAQISKAFTSSADANSAPLDERMIEILVGPEWVLLRAKRKDSKGKEFIAERVTHAANVRDFEPAMEPEEGAEKKGKKPATTEPNA